jgi:hypothetical protein
MIHHAGIFLDVRRKAVMNLTRGKHFPDMNQGLQERVIKCSKHPRWPVKPVAALVSWKKNKTKHILFSYFCIPVWKQILTME